MPALKENLIKTVEELLAAGWANTPELQHILKLLKEERPLPRYDKIYLQRLLEKNKPGYRGANSYKSEGTSLVLSLFFGLLGFLGIGHRYVGNISRSIVILYAGGAIMVAPLALYFGLFFAEFQKIANSNGGYGSVPLTSDLQDILSKIVLSNITFVLLVIAMAIGYFVLLIWQVFDARSQTRKFNAFMDKTGVELFEVNVVKKIAFGIALVLPILTVSVMSVLFYFLLSQHTSSSYPTT